ncbi:hypothetical protein D3C81_1612930 [compost metagenome]
MVRFQVIAAAHVGQSVARCHAATQWAAGNHAVGVAEQERLGAEAHQVGTAVVSTGLRQACGVPVQEVLGTDGQFGVDGEGRRHLVARNEQLLGFSAW